MIKQELVINMKIFCNFNKFFGGFISLAWFVCDSNLFVLRGGGSTVGLGSGIMAFSRNPGSVQFGQGFRVVLLLCFCLGICLKGLVCFFYFSVLYARL